ncbi:hypothetical protein BSU00_04900 [Tenacibaculum sp. SG-28]|nr:hypothetical protein BSU00_04900 [Tenacibaculum sp. SG-28]
MVSLVLLYLTAVDKPKLIFVSALFFSFLGDVLLLNKGDFFLYGLAAFLITHILYIKIIAQFLEKEITTKMISSSVPFLLFFIGVFYLIYSNLGSMLFPVLIYGIVIATFGAISLLNYREFQSKPNFYLLFGAILFILSDSFIAINKFYHEEVYFHFFIMLTYIIAQFLICYAMVLKRKVPITS